MTHPLRVGTKVKTLVGEAARGQDDFVRECPPGSIGKVISACLTMARGWVYGIDFGPAGPWVFIDQLDSIEDPSKYEVLESS